MSSCCTPQYGCPATAAGSGSSAAKSNVAFQRQASDTNHLSQAMRKIGSGFCALRWLPQLCAQFNSMPQWQSASTTLAVSRHSTNTLSAQRFKQKHGRTILSGMCLVREHAQTRINLAPKNISKLSLQLPLACIRLS